MDISRAEQRILHILAQGGVIEPVRDDRRRLVAVECYTRDGWRLSRLDPVLFARLRRRRAIASRQGGPYRITRRGLELVRGEPDNR